MTHAAQTLILHHYAMSPFSEKVRVILGLKSAPWRGCDQPVVMPKEQVIPSAARADLSCAAAESAR